MKVLGIMQCKLVLKKKKIRNMKREAARSPTLWDYYRYLFEVQRSPVV